MSFYRLIFLAATRTELMIAGFIGGVVLCTLAGVILFVRRGRK